MPRWATGMAQERAAADVVEQLGHEQAVGREEIHVSLVAVDGPQRPGIAAGCDEPAQQPRGADQLAGPSGGGDSCEACSPGQRSGYDQRGSPR